MDIIMKVEGLNKVYPKFSLKNVSFSLPQGCITGFIGANGAGKTTVINAVLGLIQRSAGRVEIFNQDMSANEAAIKDRIGVVLDEGYFYDHLTIEEMKSIIAPAYSAWREDIFMGYLERFSLNPRQIIGTLSRGMRMKYALSLALSHNADLLIMDEPTSGLDPLVRSELLDILKDYLEEGARSVFFSTHITSDLDKVADMLILIHEGRILWQADKDELLDGHSKVTGDIKDLKPENRKLFLNLQETDFCFHALTDKAAEVKRSLPESLLERPSVEDIMLAYIRGEE